MTTRLRGVSTRKAVSLDDGHGPYDGRISKLAGYVPRFARGFVIEAGGMAELAGKIVWSAVRHPRGYWGAVVDDIYHRIRNSWLALTLAIAAFTVFTALVAMMFFSMVGGQQLFGPTMLVQSMRTFTLWVNAIAVAGIVGASITADLGARKVREELDAMEVMGIDPLRELAVPRVVSITLITVLLSMPSIFVTMVSMQLAGSYVAHLTAGEFYSNLFVNFSIIDLLGLVINSTIVGMIMGIVCCYKGFTAAGGAIGLGRAVNQAVVIGILVIWVFQLPYQALLLGLFPNLGAWK